jgi:hypothetical protein
VLHHQRHEVRVPEAHFVAGAPALPDSRQNLHYSWHWQRCKAKVAGACTLAVGSTARS